MTKQIPTGTGTENFEERAAKQSRYAKVWLKLLCTAIQSPHQLTSTATGQALNPDQIADSYLAAYIERESQSWGYSPDEEDNE